MKIYILDDEENSIHLLEWQLKHYYPEAAVCGSNQDPTAAIEQILQLKPDILLLDIQMPHKNGFEVLEELGPHAPLVIFITAYDKYAIRAIRFSALDYLLKPIDSSDLKQALDKAKERLKEGGEEDKIMHLLETIAARNTLPGKIAIPSSEGLIFVKVDRIIRCESDNNYTMIFMDNGTKYIVSRTLKDFEELLSDFTFVRIHQSHLINLSHIEKYLKTDGGSVIMEDGIELPVSRNRKEEFMARLEKM
jgi:two-component system LytT family response regulator